VRIKNVPRRAAGPDIRHIIIGSEGTLCFITEVTVKIFKYTPENLRFMGYCIDDMHEGLEVLRDVMVNGYKPSVARLYDIEDAAMNFSHFQSGKCVLIFVSDGPREISEATAEAINKYAKARGAAEVDPKLIMKWFDHLLWGPENIRQEAEEIRQTNNIGFTTEISRTGKISEKSMTRALPVSPARFRTSPCSAGTRRTAI
jgi:alkyldihydroxyacetonephosphate synthase